jgi:hypothetical protein
MLALLTSASLTDHSMSAFVGIQVKTDLVDNPIDVTLAKMSACKPCIRTMTHSFVLSESFRPCATHSQRADERL